MNKKVLFNFLIMFLMLGAYGTSYAHASEVTGTLSSGSALPTQTVGTADGSVSGTVTNGNGGTSNGGNGSGENSSDIQYPAGSVLGASISQATSPTFPNAGVGPDEKSSSFGIIILTVVFIGSLLIKVMWSRKRTR